jgi:hypothetical protein
MKKICVILLLCFGAGCSAPGTTEINRPPMDVNGVRQLVLNTSPIPSGEFEGDTFASASYSDSATQGFGPGVLITCNSFTIIDTRKTAGQADTQAAIEPSTSYVWNYQGPDTSFQITMSSSGRMEITDPGNGQGFFFEEDSLAITYEPTGPCTNLQVVLTGFLSNDVLDTIRPAIQFDSALGTIDPIWLGTSGFQAGEGTITVDKINRVSFSSSYTHSIIVEDSDVSEPSEVVWEF